jgi:hypothetical protein
MKAGKKYQIRNSKNTMEFICHFPEKNSSEIIDEIADALECANIFYGISRKKQK